VDNTGKFEVLSLCAGYGGIELGLERLGLRLRTVAYVERESFAAGNLVAKIEEGKLAAAPVHSDVKTFPYERFRGLVDIMLAGYPCQPFSSAGNRKGTDDPRHLWPHIADGIAACQPSAVFFENVQGHVTLGLRDVLCDLGRMGYRTTWGMFSAAEVGAPHQRKRVFILGWLPDACGRRLLQAVKHQLADTAGERDREPEQGIPISNQRLPRRQEGSADVGGCLQEELADSKSAGLERQRGSTKISRTVQARPMPPSRSCEVWPARPGELQYDWEEPRTVANPKGG
jgi:site-specific DNA-cytosine methylase